MSIAGAQLTNRFFADDPMLGTEFGIVARICLPDWICGGELARPASPGRTITVRKMAMSLGSPPESTRRHVNILLDRGALALSAQGVTLAATAANEAFMVQYYLGIHDLFLRLIEDMVATCDIDLPIGATPGFGMADIVQRALEILLLPIDTFRLAGNNRMTFMLWGALTMVAVRNVTYDPVLSRLYADAIPPDDVRIGISLRSLAAMVSIPYASAWRYIQALHASGLVTRLGSNQWTVLTANLLSEPARGLSTPPSILVFRKVRELALLGLDPARAAEHYRFGRPMLATLEMPQNG